MNWENFFLGVNRPNVIYGTTAKPNKEKFINGIYIRKSLFINIQQVIDVVNYSKNCQIDTSFFDGCYSNSNGGCLLLFLKGTASLAITKCGARNCYSGECYNFLYTTFDYHNISTANIEMTSICSCSNKDVQEVLCICFGHAYIANYNNSLCQTSHHCAPAIGRSNSKLKFLNIASNTAKTIILFVSGESIILLSNIINNTETKELTYNPYNGTICTKLVSSIRVVSCFIESGSSFLACSQIGQITFADCCLDHQRILYNSTVLFEGNFSQVEMTLLSTREIGAKYPYREVWCTRRVPFRMTLGHILCKLQVLFTS